jgi:hypothetical protein
LRTADNKAIQPESRLLERRNLAAFQRPADPADSRDRKRPC